MKTILYKSKFKKGQSAAYEKDLAVTPDEVVEWDGNPQTLPEHHSVSSLPCLVFDPEGAVEEETVDGKTIEKPMQVKRFEYRKNETKIKTKVQVLIAKAVKGKSDASKTNN